MVTHGLSDPREITGQLSTFPWEERKVLGKPPRESKTSGQRGVEEVGGCGPSPSVCIIPGAGPKPPFPFLVHYHVYTMRAHAALPQAKPLFRPQGWPRLPQDIHFGVLQRAGGHLGAFSPEALLSSEGQQRQGTTQIPVATTHLCSKPPYILHHVLFTPGSPQFCGYFPFHTMHTSTLCDRASHSWGNWRTGAGHPSTALY